MWAHAYSLQIQPPSIARRLQYPFSRDAASGARWKAAVFAGFEERYLHLSHFFSVWRKSVMKITLNAPLKDLRQIDYGSSSSEKQTTVETLWADTLISGQLYFNTATLTKPRLNSSPYKLCIYTFPYAASSGYGHFFCFPRVSTCGSFDCITKMRGEYGQIRAVIFCCCISLLARQTMEKRNCFVPKVFSPRSNARETQY